MKGRRHHEPTVQGARAHVKLAAGWPHLHVQAGSCWRSALSAMALLLCLPAAADAAAMARSQAGSGGGVRAGERCCC